MFGRTVRPTRRALAAAAATGLLALTLAACGSSTSTDHASMPAMAGMSHSATPSISAPGSAEADPSMGGMDGMDGMGGTAAGDGLSAAKDGYRLKATTTSLPGGKATAYRFTITGPDGRPVTAFAVDQTKRLHFYAIRTDLTGFQHLHPTMAADGTWTARLAALQPGTWRLFASFTPDSGGGKGQDFVLSTTATVPGMVMNQTLPKPSATATVDGYTVTVNGALMAGMAHTFTLTVSKDGRPVTDLQPYLDTYAHLTAFHAGDQAFAHLHPETKVTGGHGGPALTFHAELPRSGDWRLFLQFRTAGRLHTAALTLHAN